MAPNDIESSLGVNSPHVSLKGIMVSNIVRPQPQSYHQFEGIASSLWGARSAAATGSSATRNHAIPHLKVIDYVGGGFTIWLKWWKVNTCLKGRQKMISTPRSAIAAVLLFLLLAAAGNARAEPILQLYLEGGIYDSATESWYIAPPGSSAGVPFRLWVIGNTAQAGIIHDVRLSLAYAAEYRTGERDLSVSFSPSAATLISDPSVPTAPTFIQYGAAGTVPLLGDGSPLPPHGVFGPNTVWQEWLLGDFELKDSPLGDFVGSFPTSWKANAAQVNVYDVAIQFSNGDSAHGVQVHFDVYNHVEGGNHVKYKFAPFSHDADGTVDVVPAPPALVALMGMGVFLPFGARRFLRASKS